MSPFFILLLLITLIAYISHMQELSPSKNNRRQFLKNASLVSLSVGFAPFISKVNAFSNLTLSDCNLTTLDYYGIGPFYTANAPDIVAGQLWKDGDEGTILSLSGYVRNLNCEGIANVEIDLWHADHAGDYDNSGYSFRGKVYTDDEGYYQFETILPGKYLNGSQYRPSHIHFKISAPGQDALITQLYFEGDSDIANDAAANISSGQYDARERTIPLSDEVDGKVEGVWDIIVDDGGVINHMEEHLKKGMIYTANASGNQVEIEYSVFDKAKVNIAVYDMQGRLQVVLDQLDLVSGKYQATWDSSNASKGVYLIVLFVNDERVHHLKVMKR